jgi:hypothetical protein
LLAVVVGPSHDCGAYFSACVDDGGDALTSNGGDGDENAGVGVTCGDGDDDDGDDDDRDDVRNDAMIWMAIASLDYYYFCQTWPHCSCSVSSICWQATSYC